MDSEWLPVTELPGDGESIWIVVREHDNKNHHVDYAVAWVDTDGLLVHRYEGEKTQFGEHWPPGDVLVWMPAHIPEVPPVATE